MLTHAVLKLNLIMLLSSTSCSYWGSDLKGNLKMFRAVTRISSCWVNTTSRQESISKEFLLVLFYFSLSYRSSQRAHSWTPEEIPGPWPLMKTLMFQAILNSSHSPMKPFITAITANHKTAVIRIATHRAIVLPTIPLYQT